jgi:hypothetical protein
MAPPGMMPPYGMSFQQQAPTQWQQQQWMQAHHPR